MNAREIEDRIALRSLVDSYALFVDTRERDAFAALFTPEGRIVSRRADGSQWIGQGSEELKTKVLSFRDPPPYKLTYHLVANHVCTVAGDAATGVTHCVAHHLTDDTGGSRVLATYLRYDDRYERAASGWRFTERIITPQWSEQRAAGTSVARDLARPPQG